MSANVSLIAESHQVEKKELKMLDPLWKFTNPEAITRMSLPGLTAIGPRIHTLAEFDKGVSFCHGRVRAVVHGTRVPFSWAICEFFTIVHKLLLTSP